jgi:hypothetical protein
MSGNEQDLPSISAPMGTAPQSLEDQQQIAQLPVKSETSVQAPKSLTAELDRLHFQSNTIAVKSSESDSDRALRRQQAEEMASSLRDDKLLSLTGLQVHRNHSFQGEGPSHALTQENLERQLACDAEPTGHPRRSSSSDAVPQTRSERGDLSSARPPLEGGRFRDSERTVTTSSTLRQDA